MIVYWTDGLFFTLLLGLIIGIIGIRRSTQLRQTWQGVFTRPAGMVSSIILSLFLLIATLDCIHLEKPVNSKLPDPVVSVLDIVLSPLIIHTEKTYSAPFALVSYSKESLTRDGATIRDYPPLDFAGQHLANPAQQTGDIITKLLLGSFIAIIVCSLLLLLFLNRLASYQQSTMRHAWQSLIQQKTALAWRSAWITFFILSVMLAMITALASDYHVLGTDKVGEDILYQSLKSIRTGVLIGTLSTLFMLPLALILGMMAGYFRGWIDDVIQYLYTTLNAIPGILLIVAAILIVDIQFSDTELNAQDKADLKLLFLCLILGLTSWTGLCRLLRAETLKLRELEYIQAAHAFGVNHFLILLRHILPNVMHLVLITIAIDFSGLVLAEAILSYIGVGVDPTMNSWGNMVNGARMEMARDPMVWWTLLAAFFFMLTLVLSANFFADAIRDAFDPKMRERQ